jgi:hypothetical protein
MLHFLLFYRPPSISGIPCQRIRSVGAVVWLKCSTHCHIREMVPLELCRILGLSHVEFTCKSLIIKFRDSVLCINADSDLSRAQSFASSPYWYVWTEVPYSICRQVSDLLHLRNRFHISCSYISFFIAFKLKGKVRFRDGCILFSCILTHKILPKNVAFSPEFSITICKIYLSQP